MFKSLGKTSSVPETFGADFLFPSTFGLVGVQRKEIKDYVASIRDGRLGKELAQMKRLGLGAVIIEGRVEWSRDGVLVNLHGAFTKHQFIGSCFSISAHGYWLLRTVDKDETTEMLRMLESWTGKIRHSSMSQRPKPKNEWGYADNRDWGIHLLQSFQGIGAGVAGRIYDHFEGVPLAWTCDANDLQGVNGVGKGRADKMIGALNDKLQ